MHSFVKNGGVRTVLAALDSHDDDFEVQVGSLQLLRDAMCENSTTRDQVAVSEAMLHLGGSVFFFCRAHSHNEILF